MRVVASTHTTYASGASLATPTIDVKDHGGEHLGLAFALRYYQWGAAKLFVDVIVDGKIVVGDGGQKIVFDQSVRGTQLIDLADYTNVSNANTVKVRFTVETPTATSSDPWRLDDIMLVSW